VIVVDLDSGQMLFGREDDVPRPMASLTKLMTALLIAEDHALDEAGDRSR
jgi:serine-type D-Ala-D-Ala carboxypeptidase (penicillin-binding protein 5/6)